MKVQVVFYGGLKREAGCGSTAVNVPREKPTVGAMAECLRDKYPSLNAHLGSVAYAVGDEMVDEGFELSEGAEVSLLPPVSGG